MDGYQTMSKQLSSEARAQVVLLLETGKSTRDVALKFHISQSAVVKIRQKYNSFNTFAHLGGNGRPSKNSSEIASCIRGVISENPKTSLRKTAKIIGKEMSQNISHASIRTYLNGMNRFAFSPIKKPLLSPKNIDLRFSLSRDYIKMPLEKIKSIIWSDESKFNLFYSDGKCSVWREPGKGLEKQNLQPTIKHGGLSVMVWACFSYHGKGKLVFIEDIMDAVKYCSILSDNLYESASDMGLVDFIFQQDNDPKHTSKLAKEFFTENNIELLPWPAQSPDMNPIENLWAFINPFTFFS